jgi:hypothetical protein
MKWGANGLACDVCLHPFIITVPSYSAASSAVATTALSFQAMNAAAQTLGPAFLLCTFSIKEIIQESLQSWPQPGRSHSKDWATAPNPCGNLEDVCTICAFNGMYVEA